MDEKELTVMEERGGNEMKTEEFQYTYSAEQQKEIADIRSKYLPKEEDKMEQLRKLDQSVTKKGTVMALVVGIVSAMLLGIGMCCCMVWDKVWFVPGILIGLIGIAGIIAAYPIFTHITNKEKERLAPEILRLTEELMK